MNSCEGGAPRPSPAPHPTADGPVRRRPPEPVRSVTRRPPVDIGRALAKVAAHVRDDLAIGGVIDGLQTDDARLERRIRGPQVPQEAQLRHRRAEQQDLLPPRQVTRDLLKESSLVIGVMMRSGQLILRVAVYVKARRLDGRLVERVGPNMKDPRLRTIHPHRRLIAHRHPLPSW